LSCTIYMLQEKQSVVTGSSSGIEFKIPLPLSRNGFHK
jgi:hypothetical protein